MGDVVERVEDLKVWQRAMELARAINAIIDRPGFLAHRREINCWMHRTPR